MTPMVDLMFLLITFFMLTTTLAKQSAMNVVMPVGDEPTGIPENRTLNLCLGRADKIQWYMGNDNLPLSTPSEINFGKDGLRSVLQEELVEAKRNFKKDLIVLVKPSDRSSYKNLVDVLDELEITGVKKYMIVDTSPADITRLISNALY